MSVKHIQLSFDVVRNMSKRKGIKLHFPPNFRKDVLFDQLLYFVHLENPAIVATGLLKDSILDSLDMIVSIDGRLSDAALRKRLDMKFPSVMRNLIPSMWFLRIKQSLILKTL